MQGHLKICNYLIHNIIKQQDGVGQEADPGIPWVGVGSDPVQRQVRSGQGLAGWNVAVSPPHGARKYIIIFIRVCVCVCYVLIIYGQYHAQKFSYTKGQTRGKERQVGRLVREHSWKSASILCINAASPHTHDSRRYPASG